MLHICNVIELIASKRCTVMISGETGTGKEVIAKAIHAASARASRPMVAVNCTALPETLIEAELFGHVKGAFTGAHSARIGRFEQANKSTIFLDEIGDIPLSFQAKLLRVLQEQEVQRVGSSDNVKLDVRVIAASNVNLEEAVAERRFRDDLYYRLNVVPIQLPPLRERREDIPLLVDHLLHKINDGENGIPKSISQDALEYLSNLDWPGNVRQLEHALHMAVALSGYRDTLEIRDFSNARPMARAAAASQIASYPNVPQQSTSQQSTHQSTSVPSTAYQGTTYPSASDQSISSVPFPDDGLDLEHAVNRFELSLLNQALAASGGNKARAANLLRIKRTTLLAKMKTLGERVAVAV